MTDNAPKPSKNEEIDLGQLFKALSNLIEKLYNFISRTLSNVFKLLILATAHFFNQLKWYAIALVIGLVAGYFLERYKTPVYGANMYVNTNFDSAKQVYEVISEFNQLAGVDKDYAQLSKSLNISEEEASSLLGFYIEADKDDSEIMKNFILYKNGLDSTAKSEATFGQFKRGINDRKYKTHKIGVSSKNKFVFKKINKGLVKQFSDNDYVNALKKTTLENLDKQEASIDEEIEKLDTLLKTYISIRKQVSAKEYSASQGTNLYMSGVQNTEIVKDETELITKMSNLQKQKRQIALERVENQNQVSVVSDFPNSGYQIVTWEDNKMYIMPIISITLLFLFFSLRAIGHYVLRYKSKL